MRGTINPYYVTPGVIRSGTKITTGTSNSYKQAYLVNN